MSGRWPLVGSWAVWPWLSRIHFDTSARVRQTDVPVHVAHGDRDIVIPVRMGLAVYQAARTKGELLQLPDAGHNDIVVRGGAAYWQWLEQAVTPVGA
jgi:pimeloyl-ACP methyl ester carboxylesterase